MRIKEAIKSIFHKCKFKTKNVPYSNERGEIWIQQCKCGKKREVLFDSHGNCIGVISI